MKRNEMIVSQLNTYDSILESIYLKYWNNYRDQQQKNKE